MLAKKTKILLYSNNLWVFGEGMLGPLFAVFAQRLGGSVLDISWAWSIYLVVTGILVILIGKVSDVKISKEKLMIAGSFLNALFTFGYIFVSTPTQLFLVEAELGVAAALSSATWSALYAEHGDIGRSGYIWGLANGQSQLTMGIAIIVGGFIVNHFSFTVLFITMGIIQLVAAIYQAQILRNKAIPPSDLRGHPTFKL